MTPRCPLTDQPLPPNARGRCIRCRKSLSPDSERWYWCSGRTSTDGPSTDDTWMSEAEGDTAEEIVQRFPGYLLQDQFGGGGGGQVFRALSEEDDEIVALKVINDATNANRRLRFQREIAAMAGLSDPGVIRILDVGYTSDGAPWFTMPLVDGPSLADLVYQHPLPAEEAVRIVEAIARTLDRLHQQGTVHRDIKPGNILLTSDGVPLLTDLGLALQLSEGDRLTKTNQVLGTPRYMAPEQRMGSVDDWPRVDTYALGVVLYECLGGRLEGSIFAPTMPELEAVPPELVWLARRAADTDPSHRYDRIHQFADDLATWRDPRTRWSVKARLQARDLWARYRTAVTITTQLALISAVVLGGVSFQAWRTDQAREAAAAAAWSHTRQRLSELPDPQRADELFDSFVHNAKHDDTTALGEAWLWAAGHEGDPSDRKQALGQALSNDDDAIRDRAVLGLITSYQQSNDWSALSVLVELLDADPEMAPSVTIPSRLRADIALAHSDIAAALPHLSAEDAAILAPLQHTRPVPQASPITVDLDQDGNDEFIERGELHQYRDRRFISTVTEDGRRAYQELTPEGPIALATVGRSASHMTRANGRTFAGMSDNGELVEFIDGELRSVYPLSQKRIASIAAMAAADLTGDGTEELIVAFGPPDSFQLEVLDTTAPELRRIAQRRFGYVSGLQVLETPAGSKIVVSTSSEFRSAALLGEAHPYGAANEIQVMSLEGDRLQLTQRLPLHPEHYTQKETIHTIHLAELDGTPPMELAASVTLVEDTERRYAVWLLRHEDGQLRTVGRLGGASRQPVHLISAVRTTTARDRLLIHHARTVGRVLGEGSDPLPISARPAAVLGDGPERLSQLGLHQAAARSWERIAATTPARAREALIAAAESWAAAGMYTDASRRREDAARQSTPPDQALLVQAIDDAILADDLTRAKGLFAALPSPPAPLARAMEALGAPLRLRFDAPLDPAWIVPTPGAVEQDLPAGQLTIRGLRGLGDIMRLPLERTSDTVGLWVTGSLNRAEQGGQLTIRLDPDGPEGHQLGVRFAGTSYDTQQERFVRNGAHCLQIWYTEPATHTAFTTAGIRLPHLDRYRCRLRAATESHSLETLVPTSTAKNWSLSIHAPEHTHPSEIRLVLREIQLAGFRIRRDAPAQPHPPASPLVQARLAMAPYRNLSQALEPDLFASVMYTQAARYRRDSETTAMLQELPDLSEQPVWVQATMWLAHAEALWSRGRHADAADAVTQARAAAQGGRWSQAARIEALAAEMAYFAPDEAALEAALERLRALAPDADAADAIIRERPALRPIRDRPQNRPVSAIP